MENLGIGERLKNAIMLEDFEDVRYTATCKYWLLDAINNVYEHLEQFNESQESNSSRRFAKTPILSQPKGRPKRPSPHADIRTDRGRDQHVLSRRALRRALSYSREMVKSPDTEFKPSHS